MSGRSEGGRSSCVTPATTNYHNRTAKAKSPKQQGAGDAEEEEEEEEEWYLQRPPSWFLPMHSSPCLGAGPASLAL